MAAPETVVRLDEKFAAFNDLWSPKIIGEINDMHLKQSRCKESSYGMFMTKPMSSSLFVRVR
jgi:hypothetical protein